MCAPSLERKKSNPPKILRHELRARLSTTEIPMAPSIRFNNKSQEGNTRRGGADRNHPSSPAEMAGAGATAMRGTAIIIVVVFSEAAKDSHHREPRTMWDQLQILVVLPSHPRRNHPASPTKQFLDKNKALGCIEEADSPWSAACFFTHEKDGTLRLLQDYCKVNKCALVLLHLQHNIALLRISLTPMNTL